MDDTTLTALCVWREARGEGHEGMLAVASVIRNRCVKRAQAVAKVILSPLQFSSMTAPGDPQLTKYASPHDPQWIEAEEIAQEVLTGMSRDPTKGATVYFADYIPFPAKWDKTKLQQTVKIGRHIFFREI